MNIRSLPMNKRITRRIRIRSKQQRKLHATKPKIPATASIFFFPVWVRKPMSRFHLILQTTSNDMDRFRARQRMVRRCAINFAAIEPVVNDACCRRTNPRGVYPRNLNNSRLKNIVGNRSRTITSLDKKHEFVEHDNTAELNAAIA